MGEHSCRACGSRSGEVVLDLGNQPACDYFPGLDDPGPDPVYPLQMWLCAACSLAQLVVDPTIAEEPRGTEPAALVAQAADAVERVSVAGWLSGRHRVAEYGSPHGGSWLELLAQRGVDGVGDDEPADMVLDCFGLMHAADQSTALAERAGRLGAGGVLLLQYHSLDTIVRCGQWNALRHGHYAYYSTTALTEMLRVVGFRPREAWRFELYGGTVLLAATRDGDRPAGTTFDDAVVRLLATDDCVGARDPMVLAGLQRQAQHRAERLHHWLTAQRLAGNRVLGYGAASRAVALLVRAGIDRDLLPAVVDASEAKQGRRMPGTNIPIISPAQLSDGLPAAMVLFLPDLLAEVRASYPEVEATGGRWVDEERLDS
jgi:C-methyltransferase C-terminal domain/Putative zinc binding domain